MLCGLMQRKFKSLYYIKALVCGAIIVLKAASLTIILFFLFFNIHM